MEPEERPENLYDFLYRDSSRITSYYAQIFGGHLTTLEQTESQRDTKDKGAKLDFQLTGGDIRSGQENEISQRRVVDPHDVLTMDVLSFLEGDERISRDVNAAPHGSLIIAKGTLVLVDRSMLELAIVVLDAEAERQRKAARTGQEKAQAQSLKQVIPFLSKVVLPSGFLLHTANEIDIAGTLKESGMDEPISTYYFKHGTSGLSAVYMIGIKEVPTQSFTLPSEQMIGAGQLAAQALRNMMFPPDATMVTPIALFRKI